MTRHPFDPLSFVFGVLFVALGATALGGLLDSDLLQAELVWPAVLILIGAALLLSLAGDRTGRDRAAGPAATAAAGSDAADDVTGDQPVDDGPVDDESAGDDAPASEPDPKHPRS